MPADMPANVAAEQNLPSQRVITGPLNDILIESLAALAAAGDAEAACRLAGRACAVYRHRDIPAWNRFNGLLHRLARKAPGGHGAEGREK
jgi:hypothetical protein